ncbi:MAG: hypothetical protein AB2556_16115 [Candidatus Thiodiazotropha sp.]
MGLADGRARRTPLGADLRAFLEGAAPQISGLEEVRAPSGVALKVQLRNDKPGGGEEHDAPVLRSRQEPSSTAATLPPLSALETLAKWTRRGSGLAVEQVLTLWLDITRYRSLRGGSYLPLPAAVKATKAVVNVKNRDDDCLRWSLCAACSRRR